MEKINGVIFLKSQNPLDSLLCNWLIKCVLICCIVARILLSGCNLNPLSKMSITFILNFPEMVDSMKKVAGMDVELTVEERNLLSVAYKNVIGARRASWRIISSIEQKEENKGGEDKLKMIREYRQTVRCALTSIH